MNSQPQPATDRGIDRAAIIAIGSNLPGRFESPEQLLRKAMDELRRLSRLAPAYSSLYRSKPVDCPPDAPDFINAAAALWPPAARPAESLLGDLLQIEADFGRCRRVDAVNASRTLDLDLICWGGRMVSTAKLQLPHPRFASREFVLAPLAELGAGPGLRPARQANRFRTAWSPAGQGRGETYREPSSRKLRLQESLAKIPVIWPYMQVGTA